MTTKSTTSQGRRRRRGRVGAHAPLLLAAGFSCMSYMMLGGCQKSLFSERQPRTQYEQYDRMHGTFVPTTITDRNGDPRPALRERLRPPQG